MSYFKQDNLLIRRSNKPIGILGATSSKEKATERWPLTIFQALQCYPKTFLFQMNRNIQRR